MVNSVLSGLLYYKCMCIYIYKLERFIDSVHLKLYFCFFYKYTKLNIKLSEENDYIAS